MKKKIKRENMKVQEASKKEIDRGTDLVEGKLDDVSGGLGLLGGAGVETKVGDIEIGPVNTNITGITFDSIDAEINIKSSGKNNTVQNTGTINISK